MSPFRLVPKVKGHYKLLGTSIGTMNILIKML